MSICSYLRNAYGGCKRTLKTVHRIGLRLLLKQLYYAFRREGLSAGLILLNKRIRGFLRMSLSYGGYEDWIGRYDTIRSVDIERMKKCIMMWDALPLISIITPTYNSNSAYLTATLESVVNQIYPNWELCIADDDSTKSEVIELLEKYQAQDSRIKVVFRKENGHISAASNSALELAKGEWVALLDHDDLLDPAALFWVADAINKRSNIQIIYSDEDKVDEDGKRFDPYFKPDWNVDLFYSQNYFSHFGVYRRGLIDEIGGFRVGFEGAQDYDLVLRCLEKIDSQSIYHIPRVLYHWRSHLESTACNISAKSYATQAGERALNEHFQRTGIRGSVEAVSSGYRAHYDLPSPLPLVSLIIPTKNSHALVHQCIESIVSKTTYQNYEILLVDNNSDEAQSLDYFSKIASDGVVRLIRYPHEFNYSAINNFAVGKANGEIIGLINNDIEVISPEWLAEMVSLVCQEGVGAVGAKLLYPNGSLQHGGVVLGVGGVAGHAMKGIDHEDGGYFSRSQLISAYSAVTAACLLVKKSAYLEVGGLNENELKVAFNDVDFCLRLKEVGYRNIWTPYAQLYHHESATRGLEDNPEKIARFNSEVRYMQERWACRINNDPAYNPNLTLNNEDFTYSWPPRTLSEYL